MNRNFKIVDYIILELDGVQWDLHNDFDLLNIEIDTDSKVSKITWIERASCANKRHIILTFTDSHFISSSTSLDISHGDDNRTLLFAGYLPYSDRFASKAFYPEGECATEDCIIFAFEDSSYITIGASSAFASSAV